MKPDVLRVMFQYRMSPIVRGAVFVVPPTVYALATPLWGRIVDSMVSNFTTYIYFTFTILSLCYLL